jgi:hypothetical protein
MLRTINSFWAISLSADQYEIKIRRFGDCVSIISSSCNSSAFCFGFPVRISTFRHLNWSRISSLVFSLFSSAPTENYETVQRPCRNTPAILPLSCDTITTVIGTASLNKNCKHKSAAAGALHIAVGTRGHANITNTVTSRNDIFRHRSNKSPLLRPPYASAIPFTA